jgi:hypothetical protein
MGHEPNLLRERRLSAVGREDSEEEDSCLAFVLAWDLLLDVVDDFDVRLALVMMYLMDGR